MKPSKFNIVQPYGDNVLIYNTFSTSMVELEPQLYTNIFENGDIRYKKEIEQLTSMGFLVDDSLNELAEQKQLRDTVVSTSGDIISNIIIIYSIKF